MDPRLNPEKLGLMVKAREFARERFTDGYRLDKEEAFPAAIHQAAGSAGLLGAYIPKEFGGLGIGFLGHTLIMEEFWRVDPGIGNILLGVFGSELLMFYGSEELKRRWLPTLAEGRAISCCAITEPNAGSDIFSVATSALPSRGGWRLDGTKQFITGGTLADVILILAVSDPGQTSRRFSFFVAEKDSAGISSEKMKGKLGIRASDTAELVFRDLFVPESHLLGKALGQGFAQVMHLFNINRVFACGQGVGVAQGAIDLAIEHLRENPLQAGKQTTQFRLAEMLASVLAARSAYYSAGWKIDQGDIDPAEVAMAKLLAGETGVRVARDALGIVGVYAEEKTRRLSRFYRDAKIVEIYEGAKDLEKLTIARQVLKRPMG
ncbi:acyl-CoA dehydrogenase family protein [Desulfatiglans anilini]|uniref:acyl-CoA dehydrogenase family protein n=1 Tax=Desulfatiglans anilini TaxID=90728 RepID=UPI000405B8DB|nr:acyl-CoA dehydrogenase family protein [Desulfatiglans anilini]